MSFVSDFRVLALSGLAALTASGGADSGVGGSPQSSATAEVAADQSPPSASTDARLTHPADPKDFYPPASIRLGQQGTAGVLVCVNPKGELLRDPIIAATSGFPEIDAAAIEVAKASQYRGGTQNGAPMPESCIRFKVQFKSNPLASMVGAANPGGDPAGTKRRKQQGTPIVMACVGPNGELLREPVIVESSGFPEVDAAAVKIAKAARYVAGKADETPLPESCIKFKVKFELQES
jgi:TonB family protein